MIEIYVEKIEDNICVRNTKIHWHGYYGIKSAFSRLHIIIFAYQISINHSHFCPESLKEMNCKKEEKMSLFLSEPIANMLKKAMKKYTKH